MEQEIRFCTAADGVRLAYATAGEGPPLVKAANYLTHLEHDWQGPVWHHWLRALAQHHTLVRDLPAEATPRTALIVAPCVASLYEDDDLPAGEGRDLLRASLSILRELAATLDVPVLVSSSPETAASASVVADAADATIEATSTDQGVRYASDDFETLVYWNEGYWQTTIPYWVDLLGAVAEAPFAAADPVDLLDARA